VKFCEFTENIIIACEKLFRPRLLINEWSKIKYWYRYQNGILLLGFGTADSLLGKRHLKSHH